MRKPKDKWRELLCGLHGHPLPETDDEDGYTFMVMCSCGQRKEENPETVNDWLKRRHPER